MEIQVGSIRFMEVSNPGISVGFDALSGKARRWVAWNSLQYAEHRLPGIEHNLARASRRIEMKRGFRTVRQYLAEKHSGVGGSYPVHGNCSDQIIGRVLLCYRARD